MAASEHSRSVLNQYVENRNIVQELIQGNEIELLKILNLLDCTRQKWAGEVQRNSALCERIDNMETELSELRGEVLTANEQLRHARAQIAALISEKDDLKIEYDEMAKKFELVKELIKPDDISSLSSEKQRRLAFLNDSRSAPKPAVTPVRFAPARKLNGSQDDDVDYDKSDNTLEQASCACISQDESYLRNGKLFRRSRSGPSHYPNISKRMKSNNHRLEMVDEETEVPSKRLKGSPHGNTSTLITTTTTVSVDPDGNIPPKAKVTVRRSLNRSLSESDLLILEKEQKDVETAAKRNALTPKFGAASTLDLRSPLVPSRSWINGGTIESRGHTFIGYTTIIMVDRCDICSNRIGFGSKPAVKCTDCNIHLHKSCANKAPMPCVPRIPTPRTPGKQRPRLKDFCPNTQPMIPHVIIHCVLALEKHYIDSEGLYRIPGQESQVMKLLSEFRNTRFQPKLKYQDPETITGCIKRFLRQLRDSLIPSSSWDEFVAAARQNDPEVTNRCIMDLPVPNRDTLAYLCSHFQKVCENSARNKMTPEALARSVAPTIVGRSPMRTINVELSNDEAMKQTQVMLTLLRMPRQYWPKFYTCEMISLPRGTPNSRALLMSRRQLIVEKKTPLKSTPLVSHHGQSKISPSAADRSLLGPIRTPPLDSNARYVRPSPHRRNFHLNPI